MVPAKASSVHLGLLFHSHQPVGNFSWICQEIYEKSYQPLVEALERHPGIHVSLHYSGYLLDWLKVTHADFLQRIARLVKRGQVEMVSGGYYEPILPSIPDADKVAQIRHLTTTIQEIFETKPTGMWLAERVWEPDLPRFLHEAGIEWTILDDVHFKNAGLEDDDLYGYYTTDNHDCTVKVFATNKLLRYVIPWHPVGETIEILRGLATLEGDRILVMGDDSEKFGSWPGTQEYCWGNNGQEGWIEEFFTALEQNSAWLHTTPLGGYARKYPAIGRIYIPTSSYVEMTQWALPSHKAFIFDKVSQQLENCKRDDVLQFVRGGFWRNFLVRYHEANIEHKKMLRVHDIVHAAGGTEEAGMGFSAASTGGTCALSPSITSSKLKLLLIGSDSVQIPGNIMSLLILIEMEKTNFSSKATSKTSI